MMRDLIFQLVDSNHLEAAKELSEVYLKTNRDFDVMHVLAKVYFDLKKFDKSLECLDAILKFAYDDNYMLNKARCLYYLRKADEAEDIVTNKISKELSEKVDNQVDICLYQTAQGKFEEVYEKLGKLKNLSDPAKFNYGWHCLGHNRFRDGFKYIRTGAKLHVWGNEWINERDYGITQDKLWNGETVDTIAFILEGGLGDEMIFIRYAQCFEKYAKNVKIFAHRNLVRFFLECGYENIYCISEIIKEKWDLYVPAMSAPYLLKLDSPVVNDNKPYLIRENKYIPELDQVAQGKKKICIRWKGNPEFEHDQFRSFPLDPLLKLDKYGQLFSIQIDDKEDMPKNANVWDLRHLVKSWSDTSDIFSQMDLIVTSCTSTAHLASAMGKKTIVLVPLVPYFVWASDDIKWYGDNVTVIRQTKYNDWTEAIEKLNNLVPTLI
jgi:hypothetical protein